MFWWIPHARVFGPVISSREPTNIHQLNPNIHILVEFPYYNSLNILVKNASLQLVGSSAVLVGSSPGKGFRVSNAFWGQMAQKKTTGMSSGCFQHFRCPQEILNSWIVHIWFTYDSHMINMHMIKVLVLSWKNGENMLFDSPSPNIMAFGPCWARLDLNHSFLFTLDWSVVPVPVFFPSLMEFLDSLRDWTQLLKYGSSANQEKRAVFITHFYFIFNHRILVYSRIAI